MSQIIDFFSTKRFVEGAETTAPCYIPISFIKRIYPLASKTTVSHISVMHIDIDIARKNAKKCIIHQLIIKHILLDCDSMVFKIDKSDKFNSTILFIKKQKSMQNAETYSFNIR